MKLTNLCGKAALIAAFGLAALQPTAASASDLFFDLDNGNSPQTGTMGQARTYTANDGVTQVKVRAYTAVPNGQGGYTLQDSYVGSYNNGLGVTSTLAGVDHQSHTVDNELGYDFLVFQFSKWVTVDLAKFNVFSVAGQGDSDATIGIASTGLPFSTTLDLNSWGDVTSLFTNMFENDGTGVSGTRGINPNGYAGNLLFVAAGKFGEPSKVDNFKIASLTAAVPESATWAMMIVGMGLVGATMRRRATRVAFA